MMFIKTIVCICIILYNVNCWDMYKIIKTLNEVNFDGIIIPDHNPTMGSLNDRVSESNHYESKYGVENRTATAFAIGYMKALVERVEDEI